MNETTFLTRHDLDGISPDLLPMPVFSDNLRSFFSLEVKVHESGNYGHMMWLIRPGVFASQGNLFQRETIDSYLDDNRLKIWWCKLWTEMDRRKVITLIEHDLDLPWYQRLYDYPAILGQFLNIPSLQVPGLRICSDGGNYLSVIDHTYNLAYPDPEQVNHWLEQYPERYEVWGRYVPD